jgi:hypothetical protein
MAPRKSPVPEITRSVVNQSSRFGVAPSLIVLHITVSHNRPGLTDIVGIADFFDRTSTQASSHVVNDQEGNDAVLVPDDRKAWTQSAYNSPALSIEQIHFDHTISREKWMRESPRQLANTALWIAHWSIKHGIPIRRAVTPGSGIVARSGVATHKQLGASGGGHVDPGTGYPLPYVLWLARYFAALNTAKGSARHERCRREVNGRRAHYGLKPLTA